MSTPLRAAVPVVANAVLSLVVVAGCLWLYAGLRSVSATMAAISALGVAALTTVMHWALIHEAIHGHLWPTKAGNDRLGRLLAILYFSPLAVLRFGHLSHQALNATAVERPEALRPPRRRGPSTLLVYHARLLFGLYLVEVAGSVLALLPVRRLRPIVRRLFYEGEAEARGMAGRAERHLLDDAFVRQIRVDGLLSLALLGTAFWAAGANAPWLVAALALRALIVSFMDNAPHYGGALGDPAQGHDMDAPAALTPLLLNSNLHGTHHRHPSLPWTALPGAMRADGTVGRGSYFRLPLRQLRGPLVVAWLPVAVPPSTR